MFDMRFFTVAWAIGRRLGLTAALAGAQGG